MSPPSVTVVIPTRDRWSWVCDAIDVALGQRDVEVELIVVDDASIEPPPRELLGRPGVRWERQSEHGGVAAARNHGVSLGTGTWIACLDDDDLWAPEHLSMVVGACEAEGAGFGYSASWIVDEDRCIRSFRPAPAPGRLVDELLRANVIGTPSGVVMRRTLWDRVGGFDTRLSAMADWDLWLRLPGVARPAASATPTLAYTEHAANMSLHAPTLMREYRVLSDRYASLTRARDVRFGGNGFPLWVAHGHRRAGRRFRAAWWYGRSAVIARRPSDALRAVGMLGGERVMDLVGSRPRERTLDPPTWLTEIQAPPHHTTSSPLRTST